MSAIFGIYNLDGKPVAHHDLERMMHTLAHRGPDGAGLWKDGAIGLGHRMLWTTPESLHEHLPSSYRTKGLRITADARIDNRDELIDLLRLTETSPEGISDSELILAAYERWGEDCAAKLIGDFAFVIYNARTESLFCARDSIGAKHFYYYYKPNGVFIWASELKALLCLPEVPQELNEARVADHLLSIFDDKTNTFYKNLLRISPAHCMVVRREGVQLRRYWSPDLSRELKLRSNENYAEALREFFTEAVRCRLRSAFPVGSMLSGGLDSSSIACIASQLLAKGGKGPLLTFSAIWPDFAEIAPESDERRYVESVASRGGIDPHFLAVDRLSPLTDVDEIFWHEDDALPAPNVYMDWALYKAARSQGCRILFSGTDGDSTVSYGYDDLSDFARRGWWRTLVKESYALSKNQDLRAFTFKKLVWHKGFKTLIPQVAHEHVRQCWRVMHGQTRIPPKASALTEWTKIGKVINPEFARRIGLEGRIEELRNDAFPANATNREAHWHSVSSGLFSYCLESLDKAAAAFAVEPRYPFFDRRLIEFCLALPPGQRIQNGWTRSILRRAMAGILPPEIQWRKSKSDISVGFRLNLLEFERETLQRVILHHPEIIQNYVDLSSLQDLYRRYTVQPRKSGLAFNILLAVTLDLWLRKSGLSSASKMQTKEVSYAL